MRIAFVDLVFCWPPNGGADVDLYNTARELQAAGHEVHVFVSASDTGWERGRFDPARMPFPATRLEFRNRDITGPNLAARFREELAHFAPDVVFVCDGFFLKPWVIEGLSRYPIISRYYAYEATCIRDLLLYKDGASCPYNYLETPNLCRRCAVSGMGPAIRQGRYFVWVEEFMRACAYLPGYYEQLAKSIRRPKAILVYNDLQKSLLQGLNSRIYAVPGGVDIAEYTVETDTKPQGMGAKTIILMTGRVEDPLKGLNVLLTAGEKLARGRSDFEIWATHTDHSLNSPWFKAIGWHDHDALKAVYAQADICVVPSVWEEPFGLVAVEAMASGKPVCASRVGGLQSIVLDGQTGFLFAREDAGALAHALEKLLDDPELRLATGRAARQRAETLYDWKRIIQTHYPPILEAAIS